MSGQVKSSSDGSSQVQSIQVKAIQNMTNQVGSSQVILGTRVWPYSVLLVDKQS